MEKAKEIIGKYKSIISLKKEGEELKYSLKEELQNYKFDFAQTMGLKNKKGEIDEKKVKDSLILEAIQIKDGSKKNKKAEALAQLEDYIEALKDIEPEKISRLKNMLEEIENNKQDLKIEKTEDEVLDKEECGAVDKVSEKEFQKFKEEKKKEYNESLGKEEKPPKINTKIEEVEEVLKKEKIIKG